MKNPVFRLPARRPTYVPVALILAACVVVSWGLLVSGCGNGSNPTQPKVPGNAVPDFAIQDVNPNSTTHGNTISPRIYIGQISCWYFGHST